MFFGGAEQCTSQAGRSALNKSVVNAKRRKDKEKCRFRSVVSGFGLTVQGTVVLRASVLFVAVSSLLIAVHLGPGKFLRGRYRSDSVLTTFIVSFNLVAVEPGGCDGGEGASVPALRGQQAHLHPSAHRQQQRPRTGLHCLLGEIFSAPPRWDRVFELCFLRRKEALSPKLNTTKNVEINRPGKKM